MRTGRGWILGLTCLLVIGCSSGGTTLSERIDHNLNQLDPADRASAEQQKFCAVETDNQLGSMGVPVKVILKGQPIFLCCKSCRKTAEAEPDKTLATAKKLREANRAPADKQPPPPKPDHSGS